MPELFSTNMTLAAGFGSLLGAAFSGIGIGMGLVNIFYILLINIIVRAEQVIMTKESGFQTDKSEEENSFLVGCQTEHSFMTWKKLTGMRGIGKLAFDDNKVTFQCSYLFWGDLELPVNSPAAQIEWVGRVWRNGFVDWFSLEMQGKKIYMTADLYKNGFALLTSESKTLDVYNKMRNIQQNSQDKAMLPS